MSAESDEEKFAAYDFVAEIGYATTKNACLHMWDMALNFAANMQAERDAKIQKIFDDFDVGMYQNHQVTNYRTEASAFAFDAIRKIMEGKS